MKNKKSLYILLPLVIIIWGSVFWKLFWGTQSNVLQQPKTIINEAKGIEMRKESFELSLNYDDPFLRASGGNKPASKNEIPNLPQNVNRVVSWPKLEYHGLIKSHSTDKTVGMLNLNGKKYLVHLEDEVQGIFVVAIFPDSIVLINQLDKRCFKRNGL